MLACNTFRFMDTSKESVNAARASKGGAARMKQMTVDERKALASAAAKARWRKAGAGEYASLINDDATEVNEKNNFPVAKWPGILTVGNVEIPVYVLEDGRRIISRTGATTVLTGGKGGGNLESYIQIRAIEPYMPPNLQSRMIDFTIPEVVNKSVKGMDAETYLEICSGYVRAMQDGQLTETQVGIAMRAAMFAAACSKVGLIALIDEATGYQFRRADEELQLKLRLFLLEEMRKWDRTFPNELWEQFGRLTNWKGAIHQRPKYWGKLVMELIYEYLDPDVAEWLRENAPKPQKGQNYHQWLTSQYGLRRLVEHIWKVVGIASTCSDVNELKRKMEELYGRKPGFQFSLKLGSGPGGLS
jgi:hypothetical protein